tara:strand:- start:658 stop:1560 length:903 start_codon:yes stop_codon:yes gene_type:complete
MTYINQGRHVGTVGVTDPESLGGEVSFRTDDFIDYKIHTFTTSGTFEVTGTKPVLMDVMSIAGGGGGSGSGGGAGGMVDESFSIQPGIYDIFIGGGASATDPVQPGGGNTTFRLQGFPNTNVAVTDAIGGGSGQSSPNRDGGSGSGSSGSGTVGQGNNGGNHGGACGSAVARGGGGGAGTAGTSGNQIGGNAGDGGCRGGGPGGSGGQGLSNSLRTGSPIFYAGGGQGGGVNLGPPAPDGSCVAGHGGGGNQNTGSGSTPMNGVQNKGGGGGHTGFAPAGIGGSGIVVIRSRFPARDGIV